MANITKQWQFNSPGTILQTQPSRRWHCESVLLLDKISIGLSGIRASDWLHSTNLEGYNMVLYTVLSCYTTVQYIMRLHTIQWLEQNRNQVSKSQNTPHSSPLRASCGVSVVRVFAENWSHYNGIILYHNTAYNTVVTQAEQPSNFELTQDIPYLTSYGLWGVCCEKFWENWPLYIGKYVVLHIDGFYWYDINYIDDLAGHYKIWLKIYRQGCVCFWLDLCHFSPIFIHQMTWPPLLDNCGGQLNVTFGLTADSDILRK